MMIPAFEKSRVLAGVKADIFQPLGFKCSEDNSKIMIASNYMPARPPLPSAITVLVYSLYNVSRYLSILAGLTEYSHPQK